MALSSLGDLSRSFMLRAQTTALKTELDRRSFEATTGRVRDVGQAVRGDFTPLAAIDGTLARLQGYAAATSEAGLLAAGQQAALKSVSEMSQSLAASLLLAASPGNPTGVDAVGREARVRFEAAVGTFNGRLGDRSLFAGSEVRGPALVDPALILDALVAASATAVSADEVASAVNTWFADPAGFAAVAYAGGAALDRIEIAPGETVLLDATADDPAVRQTLKGLAIAALLDRGLLAGDGEARTRLARAAGEALLDSASDRTGLAARIGTAESRLAIAETRNAAEGTTLQIARSGITEVDGYRAASALTQAEAQLDTLYAITARLSRLSLANYL